MAFLKKTGDDVYNIMVRTSMILFRTIATQKYYNFGDYEFERKCTLRIIGLDNLWGPNRVGNFPAVSP
jgi:hypothetical protein